MANRVLGLLGNIAKAPASLLWEGLKGAGRNFDRNAVGGLDELMGKDFTPGMRSMLRARAIGAMGNAIAGRESFGEGVGGGQAQLLGMWQMAQKIKQEKAQREAFQRIASGGAPPPGAPPTDFATRPPAGGTPAPGTPPATPPAAPPPMSQADEWMARAEGYDRRAEQYAALGSAQGFKAAEIERGKAKEARDTAEKLRVKFSGTPITLEDAEGHKHFGRLGDDNQFYPIGKGYRESAKWMLGQDGEKMFVWDQNDPSRKMPITDMKTTPGEKQQAQQFEKTNKRADDQFTEQKTQNAAVRENMKAMRGIGWAGVNNAKEALKLGQDRFAFQQDQTFNPAPTQMESGAVARGTEVLSAVEKVDNLLTVLDSPEAKAWNGKMGALVTMPFASRAFQAIGITEPQGLEAYYELLRQDIGRAIEGGVIHRDDVPKYKNILLTIGDDTTLAKSKINTLRNYLQKDFDKWEATQRNTNRNTRQMWQYTTGGRSGLPFPGGPRIKGITVDMGGGK